MANGNGDSGRSTGFASRAGKMAAPTAITVLLVVVWHFSVVLFEVPEAILPTPIVIVARLIELWSLLFDHALQRPDTRRSRCISFDIPRPRRWQGQ